MQPVYQDIGNLLQAAREERHWSLADVANQLHIRKSYLEALEAGDMNLLPGLPYAKGYLIRYAGFLKLDTVEVMRRFDFATKEHGASFFKPLTFSQDKQAPLEIVHFSILAALLIFCVWAIWLRVPASHDSMVMSMNAAKYIVSSEMEARVPCLKESEKLYPPCYYEKPAQTVLSMPNRLYSDWW
jgi:transcriptional regulator with XRE-family HTH domain